MARSVRKMPFLIVFLRMLSGKHCFKASRALRECGFPITLCTISERIYCGVGTCTDVPQVLRDAQITAHDVFEQFRRQTLFSRFILAIFLRVDHFAKDVANGEETLCSLAHVFEAPVVQQDLLHDEGRHLERALRFFWCISAN